MTGFGEAYRQRDGMTVLVEVRTINSRFFKITTRVSDGYGAWEPLIEATIRKWIRRGTVQVTVRVDRLPSPDDYRINVGVLDGYRRQIEALGGSWPEGRSVSLDTLLALPGVIVESTVGEHAPAESWPLVREALESALEQMQRMRIEEGRAMAADLKMHAERAAACLDEVERRAPAVAEAYRARLGERVQRLLEEFQVTLNPADLLREVSLFAERSDISEEILRLRSHLGQFDKLLEAEESPGRRLEFLVQEMHREANTIGSKANDVEIARHVIEIKAAVERIREMIQNVE